MLKFVATIVLVALPAVAGAVPSRQGVSHPPGIFSMAELNNLARLDESAPRPDIRRLQLEVADLRDQVGRMKLDRLIDTVLTGDMRRTRPVAARTDAH